MEREVTSRWTESIEGRHPTAGTGSDSRTIGIIPGEGIGPEVTDAAISVLSTVGALCDRDFRLSYAPDSIRSTAGSGLHDDEADFCRDCFAAGGAVLAGPRGGRWVYELRGRFDLFCKISPLRPAGEIGDIDGPIKPRELRGVDVLILREQSGGIYQGDWGETNSAREGKVAVHSFSYTGRQVKRIVQVGASLARRRRGGLTVVVKRGGIPSISGLWEECATDAAERMAVSCDLLDVDFAAYRLLRHPDRFDVVVAPNLFGDVLSDAGGALLGSRGLTYGGSFDAGRAAVYQTNHGAAFDLAGSDRANPGGQILSAAMMLRESFGQLREAELVEQAVAAAWRQGWRTEDLAEPGSKIIGTREMGERISDAAVGLARQGSGPDRASVAP
jgi:3-isopropylmalate dehydrogenase